MAFSRPGSIESLLNAPKSTNGRIALSNMTEEQARLDMHRQEIEFQKTFGKQYKRKPDQLEPLAAVSSKKQRVEKAPYITPETSPQFSQNSQEAVSGQNEQSDGSDPVLFSPPQLSEGLDRAFPSLFPQQSFSSDSQNSTFEHASYELGSKVAIASREESSGRPSAFVLQNGRIKNVSGTRIPSRRYEMSVDISAASWASFQGVQSVKEKIGHVEFLQREKDALAKTRAIKDSPTGPRRTERVKPALRKPGPLFDAASNARYVARVKKNYNPTAPVGAIPSRSFSTKVPTLKASTSKLAASKAPISSALAPRTPTSKALPTQRTANTRRKPESREPLTALADAALQERSAHQKIEAPKSRKSSKPKDATVPRQPNDQWWLIEDKCPPTSTLDSINNIPSIASEYKGPWKCPDPENLQLLHAVEADWAESLHLSCGLYLAVKRRIFNHKVDRMKTHPGKKYIKTNAQTVCKVDVCKASKLCEAWDQVGWFRADWFERFLSSEEMTAHVDAELSEEAKMTAQESAKAAKERAKRGSRGN